MTISRVSTGSPSHQIYLDNNATTAPLPEVVDAVSQAMLDGLGNPSSVHGAGTAARRAMREVRECVSGLIGTSSEDVIFTSGATEANNLVLQSLKYSAPLNRLVTTAVEHSSILATADHLRAQGVDVIVLPVDRNGLVDPQAVAAEVVPGHTLVSVQWANNETGVIQDIPAIAGLSREAGAVVHSDAVQAVGKIPVRIDELSVDLLSLSAHKLHGPLGVGALVGPGVRTLPPLLYGGSQEHGIRAGTENVPGIVGLGVALEARRERMEASAAATREMRDTFEASLSETGIVSRVNGSAAPRLPNTSNLCFQSIDGEALTIRLDQLGIWCSQSSACTNHRPEPSYVLREMGLSEDEAYASIRFGFSDLNSMSDLATVVSAISTLHQQLSRFAIA